MTASFRKRTALIGIWIGLSICLFGLDAALAGQTLKPQGNMSLKLETLSEKPDLLSSPKTLDAAINMSGSLVLNDRNQILVYIRVAATSQASLQALQTAGASIIHVAEAYRTVTAFVDASKLQALSSLNCVIRIDDVVKPMRHQAGCVGATTSEGDVQLKADQAREIFGIDGSGAVVGVLSDSYAGVTTPTSANDDVLTGDLPGPGNPCGRTSPVNVIEDYITADSTDEGRAMAQIVHDLAPGANLAFATAFSGLFGFADNIRKLRSQANADIIVDDVSYYSEPIFQDGPVAVAITEVVNDGALYFTSAGNSNSLDGNGHNVSSYEASAYRPTPSPALFYNGAPYTDVGATCHNFNPAGTTAYQEMQLADQGYIVCMMQWAEPWYGVTSDIDFYLTDSSFNILAYSANKNSGTSGTQTPYEAFSYKNTTGNPLTVRIIINRYSGTNTPRLKYVFFRARSILSTLFNASNSTDAFGPSICGHSGAADALSIAAVPYDDASNPESFTSRGYFTAYYGPVVGATPAAALATPETHIKPDVAATDGGANTFFGQQVAGVWRFYGTSAAAPHAAAVAALMQQDARGALTQAKAEQYLEQGAAAIPGGGPTITGAGLVNAVAAIAFSRIPGTSTSKAGSGGGGGTGGCFLNTP